MNAITFGTYNGKPIEWLVCEAIGDRKYILSKDILLQMPYNKEYIPCTWEICTLREWLNGEFFGNFTPEEQSRIVLSEIPNEDNLWYGTKGGNVTKDRIFLPSLTEVDKYFGDSGDYLNKRRKNYDHNKGKFVSDVDGYYFSNNFDKDRAAELDGKAHGWWLRTPGFGANPAAFVCRSGYADGGGGYYRHSNGGVRPALWLKLPD